MSPVFRKIVGRRPHVERLQHPERIDVAFGAAFVTRHADFREDAHRKDVGSGTIRHDRKREMEDSRQSGRSAR